MRFISTIGIFIAACIAILIMSGCEKDRSPNPRAQAAADAAAGAKALALFIDEVAPASGAAAAAIADDAGRNAAAAAEVPVEEFPPASIPPEKILKSPSAYRASTDENIKRVESSTGWGWVIGAGMTALTTLAVLARSTGAGGPIVSLLATMLLNTRQKTDRDIVKHRASVVEPLIRSIEESHDDMMKDPVLREVAAPVIAKVKKKISKSLSPEQEAAVRRALAAMEKS